MSLCERARRHVLIPLLRAATCPPTFPTGLKNRNSFIFYPLATPRNLKRIDDEPYGLLRRSSGRSGVAHPPVATSPRPQRPLILDREASRAFVRSLRSPLIDTRYYLTSAWTIILVSYLATS